MTEFELKFEIPPTKLKGVIAAMQDSQNTRQRLQASYFDTPDGALAKLGIVLRLRKEGKRWVQTAKGPTVELLERLEHNVNLPMQGSRAVPELDLSRHCETPIGKLIDKALGVQQDKSYPDLELIYSTEVQRITRDIIIGESTVEIALDQGRVICGTNSLPLCELEVELKKGKPIDAVQLSRHWCAAHGLCISTISKSMKGQRLCSAPSADGAKSAAPSNLPQGDTGDDLITAVIKACVGQILPNLSEIAGGSKQPEHIHDLRVGIRRLRTALRELGDWTESVSPAWEAALQELFKALGDHRDHDHLTQVLQPEWLAAGGPTIDFEPAACILPDLGKAVRKPQLQDAMLGLLAFVYRDVPSALNKQGDRRGDMKKVISARLNKLHNRALKDGKNFCSLDPAQQHSVRKRFKRLRYLIEFAAPLYSARKVYYMAAALKPVQDALGLYNDELMAAHTLSLKVADDPGAWFGMGWLSARSECNLKRCVKEIKKFASTKPFWRG